MNPKSTPTKGQLSFLGIVLLAFTLLSSYLLMITPVLGAISIAAEMILLYMFLSRLAKMVKSWP